MGEKDAIVGARIPRRLKDAIEKIVKTDAYLNPSDFIRTAIREKLQRDVPRLYEQFLEGGEKQ